MSDAPPDTPKDVPPLEYQPPDRYLADALDDLERSPTLSRRTVALFVTGFALGAVTTVIVSRVAVPRLPNQTVLWLPLVVWAYLVLAFAKPAGGGVMAGLRGVRGLGEGFLWSLAFDLFYCFASIFLWR